MLLSVRSLQHSMFPIREYSHMLSYKTMKKLRRNNINT